MSEFRRGSASCLVRSDERVSARLPRTDPLRWAAGSFCWIPVFAQAVQVCKEVLWARGPSSWHFHVQALSRRRDLKAVPPCAYDQGDGKDDKCKAHDQTYSEWDRPFSSVLSFVLSFVVLLLSFRVPLLLLLEVHRTVEAA